MNPVVCHFLLRRRDQVRRLPKLWNAHLKISLGNRRLHVIPKLRLTECLSEDFGRHAVSRHHAKIHKGFDNGCIPQMPLASHRYTLPRLYTKNLHYLVSEMIDDFNRNST